MFRSILAGRIPVLVKVLNRAQPFCSFPNAPQKGSRFKVGGPLPVPRGVPRRSESKGKLHRVRVPAAFHLAFHGWSVVVVRGGGPWVVVPWWWSRGGGGGGGAVVVPWWCRGGGPVVVVRGGGPWWWWRWLPGVPWWWSHGGGGRVRGGMWVGGVWVGGLVVVVVVVVWWW